MPKYIKKSLRGTSYIPTLQEWIIRFEKKYPEYCDVIKIKDDKRFNKDLTKSDDFDE